MLPARSHATSDGRLKLEPGVPDPAARPPAPGAAAPPPAACARPVCGSPARRARGLRGAHGDGFRFASEHKSDAAGGVELHHLVRCGVDGPHVVLRIDAKTDRSIEAVDVLAEFSHELSGLVELEQSRSAAHERAVVSKRGVGMAGTRVDEDLALRIGADAGDLADVDGRRASSGSGRHRRKAIAGTALWREGTASPCRPVHDSDD